MAERDSGHDISTFPRITNNTSDTGQTGAEFYCVDLHVTP